MTDYLHSGANKMNKVEAYKNDNKLLLADKLGHAKVSSLKEQNLLNTIATVQQHSNKITQLETDANKVRGAYVYKGTVETEFDLPLNDNSVGDVYNTSSTGMNYAWNGENWDELGRTIENSGSELIEVGLGLIKENGVIRLATQKTTSYGNGQILLNIAEQYNTPYSYNDDEDTYEDNPSPYIIDLFNVPTKFSTLNVSVGSFMKTQEQVDALKLQMKSVLTITHWDSGKTTRDITEIPLSAWVSNGVLFYIGLAISSQPLDYPNELLFDTINRVECIMLNTTNVSGYNIGTFFPAQTSIIINGTYWG